MTFPSSRRVGVVQGSQQAATGPEPSSGVGPAFHLDEPEPPLRTYLELGALPTAVPCARLHARHVLSEWGLNGLDPRAPAPKDLGEHGTPDPQEEGGRGLFLVAALSARWDWHPTREPAGKVVWCELEALSPARRAVGEGAGTTVRSAE